MPRRSVGRASRHWPLSDTVQSPCRPGAWVCRVPATAARVLEALSSDGAKVEIKRSEFVGPQVGAELAYNGIIAVLVVLAGIMIYIALRFEWKFAVATVVGEAHDVIVTLGFFAIMGYDFDLTVLAAILAVDACANCSVRPARTRRKR